MKTVRAKFVCHSITKYASGDTQARMSAVYGTSGENKDFTDSTPSGTFEIQIAPGKPAAGVLVPGRAYYLDITPVPLPEDAAAE